MNDELYMDIALQEAKKAYKKEEIPVGAVIVKNGKVISKAYNRKNKSNRVKDHAEIIAIDKANRKLRNWRLEDCEIYITLEPCPMCASAIEQARIKRIITGAVNKNKETRQISEVILAERENKKEVLEDECSNLLNEFFKNKR
jgi:tRNA(adenine34) deaminase